MNKQLLLSLLQLPKIGRKTAYKILEKSTNKESTLEELYHLILNAREKVPRIPKFNLNDIKRAEEKAKLILNNSESSGITILSYDDPKYPSKYRYLKEPPILLFSKGEISNLNNEHSIAVIGTRTPTDFGKRAGYKLTKYFVDRGFTIVSGLAVGCDYIGHKSCLDHNGKTIAVLPNGLDIVYPKQNSNLADEILEKGGTLISEYPIGTTPRKNHFIQRNRLQSGMSDAVCIIESALQGGTMHTFEFAINQNKIIGALLHPQKYQTSESSGNKYIIDERKGYPLGNTTEISRFIDIITKKSKFNPSKKEGEDDNSQLDLFG